jgi:TonB family protein
MKPVFPIIVAVILGTTLLPMEDASAATKKKTPENVSPAVDTKPPVTTNETWTPKTNRQPVPADPAQKPENPLSKKTPTPAKTVVLGDKLKSKILSNPQPSLPDAAKKAKVSGPVRVEVVVDERGNVISAKPVSGNSLLHAEAVKSAKKARFSPTLLKGQSVKVSGVITYNFVLQ